MEEIAYVELLAIRVDNYSMYVFRDLGTNGYLMCTLLPNWNIPNIDVGEIGFLKYQKVNAGEKYFHPGTGDKRVYNYTNTYILNFLKESDTKNSKINL